VVYLGDSYYPSGPTVFFDGAIMVRVGTFYGVPIYVDPTRDPINVVLIPVGGKLMRPYERTQRSIASDLVVPEPATMPDPPVPPEFPDSAYPYPLSFEASPRPRIRPILVAPSGPDATQSAVGGGPASQGVWIEFGGKRWTPTGPGPEPGLNLRLIGSYFDLPVYQERARVDRIFVPSKAGGPLIQYDLRP